MGDYGTGGDFASSVQQQHSGWGRRAVWGLAAATAAVAAAAVARAGGAADGTRRGKGDEDAGAAAAATVLVGLAGGAAAALGYLGRAGAASSAAVAFACAVSCICNLGIASGWGVMETPQGRKWDVARAADWMASTPLLLWALLNKSPMEALVAACTCSVLMLGATELASIQGNGEGQLYFLCFGGAMLLLAAHQVLAATRGRGSLVGGALLCTSWAAYMGVGWLRGSAATPGSVGWAQVAVDVMAKAGGGLLIAASSVRKDL
eukprot:TRINITY_DN37340_c0_g1_i1.p1 TRINITY_DN37340_c0_g1~~TRINITY_DN37340_c0_g1_i1.p1  ORF type:complete len:285 (+),score=91.09 TRINITY_DN37340_c0_g1_i1:68-856(+)